MSVLLGDRKKKGMSFNMDKKQFSDLLELDMKDLGISLEQGQIEKFYEYMNLLKEWNNKINLTAIADDEGIIKKHFIDSATINSLIKQESKVIDVGTGAGFPGIPLKIIKETREITLLDSLNKRLIFLNEVISKLNLKNVKVVHARAEDAGVNEQFREVYDIAVSRAVAPLNILVEYLLPFVKIGGKVICMKGSSIDEELCISRNAIQLLGGIVETREELVLPNSDIYRSILVIKKIKHTPNKFPRKAGTPAKQPIL